MTASDPLNPPVQQLGALENQTLRGRPPHPALSPPRVERVKSLNLRMIPSPAKWEREGSDAKRGEGEGAAPRIFGRRRRRELSR